MYILYIICTCQNQTLTSRDFIARFTQEVNYQASRLLWGTWGNTGAIHQARNNISNHSNQTDSQQIAVINIRMSRKPQKRLFPISTIASFTHAIKHPLGFPGRSERLSKD